MEFFKRLFGGKAAPIADPIELRRQLFDAANRGDDRTLLKLCRDHRAAIAEHFPSWTNVGNYPGLDINDPRQIEPVIHALGKMADVFRDQLGDSSLMDRLAGSPEDNPILKFDQVIQEARAMAGAMRFAEAVEFVTSHLIDTRELRGSGADRYRLQAHGLIGTSLFQANRGAKSLDHFRQALSLCEQLGDAEGVQVYLANLFEAHRYLGETNEAAGYARQLGEGSDVAPESRQRWQVRAAIVRAGEPLLRMVVQHGARTMEVSQLGGLEKSSKYQFVFERNRMTLAPSSTLVAAGDKLASSGKYDDALALYRDAASADPFNPQPHYQGGITLLLLERYAQAVEEYEKVRELAPGWFNVENDLWVARELSAGRLDHDAFLVAWAAENGGMDAEKRLNLLDQAIGRFPTFSNLQFHRGIALDELGRDADARAAFDAVFSFKPEPDLRSRALVQRAILSDAATQRRLFEEVLLLPQANMMSRTMAQVMLASPTPAAAK